MPRPFVFWSLAVLAVVAAVWQAWVLRWTCDDAFISFRYAQHLAEGHGLVFNLDPSERPVEGYTNFTWTLWLALAVSLGWTDAALETWSIVWGVASHGATVLLLAAIAWRASGGRALVPVAAVGYAAIHHAASLAPAGLETALFVLLATAMLRGCLDLARPRAAFWLACLGVFAAMTRPDGAIFAAMAGLFVLAAARAHRSWRFIGAYAVPFVAVFAPYLVWRRCYYGYWLPNTFYAKSGGDPCPDQGLRYVFDFFVCYWPLLLAAALLAVFVARRTERRPWLVLTAFVLPYVAFVVWVGGDFMFARFLLPVLPALLLACDFACARWRSPWPQPALAALLVLGFAYRAEPEGLADFTRPVSDNRRISFLEISGHPLTDIARSCGSYLQRLFAGLDVRIGIAGAHANLAYRSRAPVAVECAGGLTDEFIAHLPIAHRTKRGHDRGYRLYPGYLERRGVHFMFELSYGEEDAWREIVFPCSPVPVPARLVTWDRTLMKELKRRDPSIVVPDFERFLDDYIAAMAGKPKERVRADFAEFRAFYFDREDDPARRRAFERYLE